jgi:hypothetical protein
VKPGTAAVLDLLRDYGELGVTPLDALEVVGSFRLAARISELREAGYSIRTDSVVSPARRGKRYARYVLVEKPEQLVAFR